jgi:hypothetical protein
MSENWAIAIFGAIATFTLAMVSGCLVMLFSMRERIVALESRNEFEDRRIAKLSHSPHNPYGWDKSIDKYLNRHYEMSPDEWSEWLHDCEKVMDDESKPKNDRIIAARLAAVCWHKLRMPPPIRRQIEKEANKAEDMIAEMTSEKTKQASEITKT